MTIITTRTAPCRRLAVTLLFAAAAVVVTSAPAWAGPVPPPTAPLTAPSLPVPGGGSAPGGNAAAWTTYFTQQFASTSARIDSRYSPSAAAAQFADQWASLKATGSATLPTPSLPSMPALTPASLPAMPALSASAPQVGAPGQAQMNQMFGSFAGAMLSAPPSYASLAVNPTYSPASVQQWLAANGGCASNGCLGAANAQNLQSAMAAAGLGPVRLTTAGQLAKIAGLLPTLNSATLHNLQPLAPLATKIQTTHVGAPILQQQAGSFAAQGQAENRVADSAGHAIANVGVDLWHGAVSVLRHLHL